MQNDIKTAEDAINKSFGKSAFVSLDNYSNLGGFFMRYREEITDDWGIIASISYSARDYDGKLHRQIKIMEKTVLKH
ncbi:MAG: hypothetical protein ACL7BU_05735 [Candidatus Phlomobacter fragariae]